MSHMLAFTPWDKCEAHHTTGRRESRTFIFATYQNLDTWRGRNMYRITTRNTASYRQTTASRSLMGKQSSSIGVDAFAAAFNLTPAEIRTLERLLGGSSPAEIADELGVALPTVRTHLSNIFAKTGTARQLDLVFMAVQLTTPNPRSQESG